MCKRFAILLTVALGAVGLAALPSCERPKEESSSPLQGEREEPEYVIAIVLDVSGSYVERIKGKEPKAYTFFLKLTSRYAADRGDSADRILISQISRTETALLWEGTPRRLRRDFGNPDAFRDFVLARADPHGSRVYAGIAAAVERVLEFPGVQAGTARSAVFVLSDMEDNAADGPAQKQRLLNALRRYSRVKHGAIGFYWVSQDLAGEWKRCLQDTGLQHFVVEPDFVVDPPLPRFEQSPDAFLSNGPASAAGGAVA